MTVKVPSVSLTTDEIAVFNDPVGSAAAIRELRAERDQLKTIVDRYCTRHDFRSCACEFGDDSDDPIKECEYHKARTAEVERLTRELDEASPMGKCDRCGKAMRLHLLTPEEGDEWECYECWARCNAQEAALAGEKP